MLVFMLFGLAGCNDSIADLSPSTDANWMRLLISVPGSDKNREGYSYVVNRVSPNNSVATVECSVGGWNWEPCGAAEMLLSGNKLSIRIPKSVLGITENAFTIDFKWTDNTLSTGDVMDFYVSGDTAPTGRFNYRYSFK